MNLNISQLQGRKDVSMTFQLSETWEKIDAYPHAVVFVEPVNVEGTLSAVEGGYTLLAQGHTAVILTCDRCLAPVRLEIPLQLEETFKSTGSSDGETETYSGDIIDLTAVIDKSILLALPMKVLCKEDCKGLCTVCGKDLNQGDCGCDTTYRNPQFEGLLSLFNDDEEV